MKLFQCGGANPDTVPVPNSISTPLGIVRLGATVDGAEMDNTSPTQTYGLPAGGCVICWHRPEFDLELLFSRPIFLRPLQKQVTECYAGMWRLQAHAPVDSCIFTAVWEDGYIWKEGGPHSGEWLYAKSYDDVQTQVSIGTDDEDALARRSHYRDGIPTEWEPYFRSTPNHFDWFSLQPIHYEIRDAGLAIPLPPLGAGKLCQIHFIVAWAPYEEQGGATSDAVDRSAAEILAGADCS